MKPYFEHDSIRIHRQDFLLSACPPPVRTGACALSMAMGDRTRSPVLPAQTGPAQVRAGTDAQAGKADIQPACTRSGTGGSVDLIVTSPPYDVEIQYEGFDDSIPYDKYLEFTKRWLEKCYVLAKPDGRFCLHLIRHRCLNIPLDKNKGGQQSVYADITTIAKDIGWRYHSTIICPHLIGYRWNEQNISRRTAWGSWMSASAPYVIAPVEVIVVLYKEHWKKSHKGESDITRDEFIEWTNGVWNFSGANRKRIGHPAPFPVELPRRCIKLFSYVGDLVLDPFLGSGSTLIACLETDRAGIGVEISEEYCALAVKRLLSARACADRTRSPVPAQVRAGTGAKAGQVIGYRCTGREEAHGHTAI